MRHRESRHPIRTAIIGVGNCASALVQGVHYYGKHPKAKGLKGLNCLKIGPYAISDIVFSAAFDVIDGKVGQDLSQAIFAFPNNTYRFAEVPKLGVTVNRGMVHDGLGRYLSKTVHKSAHSTADVAQVLRATRTQVVVNFLPVGSEEATKWYVEQVLQAQCALVNCIPVFIASSSYWGQRFIDSKLPIVGDDVKSQVGATIVHRVLAQLFRDRGVTLDRTLQLNIGGNTDFLNMLERERLESKKQSKTNAVQSVLPSPLPPEDIHIGPSDYVPWLTDRKWAYIRLEGTAFGMVPLNLELKLEVWDSPNSAGVVVDAIRYARIALDRGQGGPLLLPSAICMKSPPTQMPDHEARHQIRQQYH